MTILVVNDTGIPLPTNGIHRKYNLSSELLLRPLIYTYTLLISYDSDVTKEQMKDILTVDTGKIKIGGETVLRSSGKKKRHPMMASTKKLLQELYAPYNKELVELTGHDGFLWED